MASGPWDNVQLPGPPNGPAYLSAAAQLMNSVGQNVVQLGNAYQSGQEFGYQQQQRNFFQDPTNQALLRDATQNGNYSPIFQAMMQQGGIPAVQQMLPLLQRQQLIQQDLNQNNEPQPPGPAAPAAGSPSQIDPRYGNQPANQSQPQLSATGADNNGAPTLNSIAADTHTNLDGFLSANPDYRKFLNQDLGPNQARAIQTRMQQYRQGSAAPNSGGANPVSQSGNGEQEAGGNELNPSMGPGGPAMSPQQGPERRIAQNAQTPQQRVTQGFNEAYGNNAPSGAAAMVPKEWQGREEEYARALKATADHIRKSSNIRETLGISTKSREDRANSLDKTADQILEQLGKDVGQTTEQKNLRTGTVQRSKEIEGEVAAGQKDLEAINKVGNSARGANDKVQLAKSLMMSPNFYSGPAEGINRSFKQWTATLGGDPNKGTPQEAFNKTISDLLSEQIRAMAQSGVGRVLVTEVQTMKNSIAAMGITPSSNRLLIEEVDRVHKAQTDIQDLANDYAQRYGHLDPGFNKVVAQYYQQHPLFSERELRDPRLIAPPRMPTNITNDPVAIKKWANQNGLKAGDPFVVQDGSGPYKVPAL